LQSQLENRGLHRFEMSPSFERLDDDVLIGSTQWTDEAEVIERRHFVLTIRDGKIADMQMCGSRRQAKQFARRARLPRPVTPNG
jgi:hypothetical protein